jgi:Protein of unknown function (DUF2939)
MKKTVIGIIGLLVLVALGWIAWPYYAVYDFANAIQEGDQVALERRVAWDSVRGGLREDFNSVLARSTQGAGLAALVGPAIINNAIDSFVTPQGITSLLRIAKRQFQTQIERHHLPLNIDPSAKARAEKNRR